VRGTLKKKNNIYIYTLTIIDWKINTVDFFVTKKIEEEDDVSAQGQGKLPDTHKSGFKINNSVWIRKNITFFYI